jgi:two-component system, LytTR family, sensor kinase
MRFFRKYLFPGLYGLCVYFTIRLLQDSETGIKFWHRAFSQNALEICLSLAAGYLAIGLFEKVLNFYDRKGQSRFDAKKIVREIFILVLCHLILLNLIFTPLSALTDDGLSLADFIFINTIPNFFAVIYYGLRRYQQYLREYLVNSLQLEKITRNNLETELKFLKSQYHPHFLFNALNTIYFQMDEDIPGTKRSIEEFSDLLRYQLYDPHQKVPIGREIGYLEGFIGIQQLRGGSRMRLTSYFDENLKGQLVYPLLFLPLVENAFKYVGGSYELYINASLTGNFIHFKVENSIGIPIYESEDSSGIGLANLKRRLELLYPHKHELTLFSGNSFIAELKIAYE